MTSTTDSATTRDGIRLLTRHWEADAPRAAVLLVHGLGEHSGRYEELGDRFAAAGLETFGWDHRGFGASGGERAYVDDWSRFHDDVEDRLAAVRAALPGRPVVLYGHSMGGLIALGYCVADRPLPDLLVLSAPGIDDRLAAWKRTAAPILARIAPRLRIANGVSPAMLSRDPARQEAARVDPLMLATSTTRFGGAGVRRAATSAGRGFAADGSDAGHPWRGGSDRSSRRDRVARAATGRRSPDLRRCPPRAPQRTRGPARSRRCRGLDRWTARDTARLGIAIRSDFGVDSPAQLKSRLRGAQQR